MYWINAILQDQSKLECCIIFESFTIAQIIADKLERYGFKVEIRNQDWETIVQIPEDPHLRLMGAHL